MYFISLIGGASSESGSAIESIRKQFSKMEIVDLLNSSEIQKIKEAYANERISDYLTDLYIKLSTKNIEAIVLSLPKVTEIADLYLKFSTDLVFALDSRVILLDGDLLNQQIYKNAFNQFEKRRVIENIAEIKNSVWENNVSPIMLNATLKAAQTKDSIIALPEADPRVLKAAVIAKQKGIATPVFVGDREEINRVALDNQIDISSIKIFHAPDLREKYVVRMVELRKHKGMTEEKAREALKDNHTLAVMMLENNEIQGIVSGAIHTTADTIRPPFQLIKTAPGIKLVSSCFLVCLSNQVLVLADCAVNPNPSAEELADIAITTAQTAQKFGITPKVAMLSYSTLGSGFGPDVDLVLSATEMVKNKCPTLAIEGPLQFDAAVAPSVAALKAKGSNIAGHANVLVFPNLTAGNICYKAIQRSTNAICIGPVIQGLKKPVNDLSRGCLVDDIVLTIAITAIQSL